MPTPFTAPAGRTWGPPHRLAAPAALAALLAAALLAGCDAILEVRDPGALEDSDLDDPFAATTLVNSVRGELQAALDDLAYFGAVLTDEAVTGHNFESWKEVDLRVLRDDNATVAEHFALVHSYRFLADTAVGRLKRLLPDPGRDLRVATTLALGGYAYVFAGEYLCESPIDAGARVFTPDEMTERAVERFEEAVAVARAAREAGQGSLESDRLIHLSRVGLARAHLQLGNGGEAIVHASQVPANFAWWVRYSSNSTRETNAFLTATTGASHNLGVDANFRLLGDPRVRHTLSPSRGHNNLTLLWTPFQPPSFDGWEAALAAFFQRETSIRLASGLEARYIVAEAQGPTGATLAFVNERRAVGGQLATGVSGELLMGLLRDQRRRDFYLDGHRLGDLRRYRAQGRGDFFPTGPHPNLSWGVYGEGGCIPIPLSEKIGNPNLGR